MLKTLRNSRCNSFESPRRSGVKLLLLLFVSPSLGRYSGWQQIPSNQYHSACRYWKLCVSLFISLTFGDKVLATHEDGVARVLSAGWVLKADYTLLSRTL
jgi:hypothetical protein